MLIGAYRPHGAYMPHGAYVPEGTYCPGTTKRRMTRFFEIYVKNQIKGKLAREKQSRKTLL